MEKPTVELVETNRNPVERVTQVSYKPQLTITIMSVLDMVPSPVGVLFLAAGGTSQLTLISI